MIVDREVQVLPARTSVAIDAIAEDRFADRPEAAEPFDVDVHEFAGPGALVALHGFRLLPR
jgi:hypothetical protein